MKKIVFFVDKISSSGASKIITWLVNNISLPDMSISLVTYLPIQDQREIIPQVNRIHLNIGEKNRIKRGILVTKKLRELMKKEQYDVCVAFLPTECLYVQVAAIGLHTKIIVCERSDPYFEKSTIADIGRFMFRFASGAVFQTEEAKAFFPTALQKRSAVIPNPAFKHKNAFVPYKERPFEISSSGRLYIRQKRQDVLINAFAILDSKGINAKLNIYGDGPDKDYLEHMVRELNLQEKVLFAGNITDVEEKISNCKVFVFTSDYEGIPNAVIEALQCGVPVVASDCSPGGARALINDGENGFLVPRDDPMSIAEKIQFILENESLAEEMAYNALNITNKFEEDDVLQMWGQYIDSVLKG